MRDGLLHPAVEKPAGIGVVLSIPLGRCQLGQLKWVTSANAPSGTLVAVLVRPAGAKLLVLLVLAVGAGSTTASLDVTVEETATDKVPRVLDLLELDDRVAKFGHGCFEGR